MEHVTLGRQGPKVSCICLGTMTFGEQVSQADAFEILDRALERGVNFIDTAEMYAVPPRRETFGAPKPSSATGSRRGPACASAWCWPPRWPARRAAWTGSATAAAT